MKLTLGQVKLAPLVDLLRDVNLLEQHNEHKLIVHIVLLVLPPLPQYFHHRLLLDEVALS